MRGNAVRAAVDDRGQDGQSILTGSATPTANITRHTGAMRIARVHMHPMSVYETEHSAGAVSLEGLLRGDRPGSPGTDVDLMGVAELLSRGGWPSNLRRDLGDAANANRDYLTTIAAADIDWASDRSISVVPDELGTCASTPRAICTAAPAQDSLPCTTRACACATPPARARRPPARS